MLYPLLSSRRHKMPQSRLDKILTHLNCGSRKEVSAWIRAGRVSVDDITVQDPAAKIDAEISQIKLDGVLQSYQEHRYIMLNKPAGIITANHDMRHETVMDLFPKEERKGLFPIGRLDKDTEGLLLITDDGALSHALMSPRKHIEKTYLAEIEGAIAENAQQLFLDGLVLKDKTVCLPAKLKIISKDETTLVEIKIQEGKYHQVKRMIAAVGGHVATLKRIQIGKLMLDEKLGTGEYRNLTQEEKEFFHIT